MHETRRECWKRWNHEHTKLRFGGELPDVLGVKFEATLDKMIEAMKPAKGEAWEKRERRAADALIQMCDAVDAAEKIETPQLAPRPLFCVDVPPDGPVEIVGIPLADAMVERLRAEARIEPVLVDADGAPVAVGRISSRCHRSCCAWCCCATGTAGVATAICATDCMPTTCDRGRGVAATSRRTWRWSRACTIRC